MNTLDVVGISKRFERRPILHDITFGLRQGEIVVLLGPSGCGKTTTLRIVAGFEVPDSGRILIGGADVARKRPYERDFGIVFQDYALFPHMTVRENIAYGIRHRRYRQSTPAGRIAEMLELVKLADYADRFPHQLSGGQRQRIALARALAPSPAVLLLDEPLSALDAAIRSELRTELRQLLRKVGTTSLIVTHDQEEAITIADRIILMDHGRVVQEGHPLEIYDAPNCRFSADFLGSCNWLRGVAIEAKPAGHAVVALAGGQRLRARGRAGDVGMERQVEIGIRPERITLEIGTDPSATVRERGANLLDGEVVDIRLLGPQAILLVSVGGQIVSAPVPRNLAGGRAAGDRVTLIIDPEDVFFLPVETR